MDRKCKTPKQKDRKSPMLATSSTSNGSVLVKNCYTVDVSDDSLAESDKAKGNGSAILKSLPNVLRKSNEAVAPETKKTTLKRFASLFKTSKKSNDKVTMSSVGVSPKGFRAVLSHTQLTKMNESGLAMAVKLPSGATSKILDVTVELEPTSSDPESSTSVKKDNVDVDLKCCEETDSKTVFVGKMRVSSATNIKELTQLPLFVVDSQDRLVINPDIKIHSNKSSSARANEESKSSGVDKHSVQNQSSGITILVDEGNNSGEEISTPHTILKMEHSGTEAKPLMVNAGTQYALKTSVNKEIDIQASLHATVAQGGSEGAIKVDKQLLYLRPNLRLVSDDVAGALSKDLLVDRSTSTTTNSSFFEYPDPCHFVFGLNMPNNSPESYSLPENLYRKCQESEVSFTKVKDFEENFSYDKWRKENYKSGFFKPTSEDEYKYNLMMNICNECFDAATNTNSRVESDVTNRKEHYLIPLSELPRKEIDKTLKLLQSAQRKLLAFVDNDKSGRGVKTLPKLNDVSRFTTDTDIFSSFPPEEKINYIQCFNNPFEESKIPGTEDDSQPFTSERSQNSNLYDMKPQGYYTKRPNFYNRFNESNYLDSIHSQPGYESNQNRRSYEKTLSGAFLGDQRNTSENHQNPVIASAENTTMMDEDVVSTFNEGLIQEIKIFEKLTQEIIDLKRIFEETSSSSIALEREKNSLNLVESKTYLESEDDGSIEKSLENQGDYKIIAVNGEEVPEETSSVRILKLKSEESIDSRQIRNSESSVNKKNPFLTSDIELVNETPTIETANLKTEENTESIKNNYDPVLTEVKEENPRSSDQPSLDSTLVFSETSSDVSENSCDQKNLCEKSEKNTHNETLILRCAIKNKWPGLEEKLKEIGKPLENLLPASKSYEIISNLIDNLLLNIDNQHKESNSYLNTTENALKEENLINNEDGIPINNKTQQDPKETTSETSQTPSRDVLVSESTECVITKTNIDSQTLPTSDFNINISTQYAASSVNKETTCKVNRILSCNIFIADNVDSLVPKSNNDSQTTSNAVQDENLGTQQTSSNDFSDIEENTIAETTSGTATTKEHGEDFVLTNLCEDNGDIESTLIIQGIPSKLVEISNENLEVSKPNLLKATKMDAERNSDSEEIRRSIFDLHYGDDQCSEETIESGYSAEQQYYSGSHLSVSNEHFTNCEENEKKEETDVTEKEEQIEEYKYDLELISCDDTVETNESSEARLEENPKNLHGAIIEKNKDDDHVSDELQKQTTEENKVDSNGATVEQIDDFSTLQKSDLSFEEQTEINDYDEEDGNKSELIQLDLNEDRQTVDLPTVQYIKETADVSRNYDKETIATVDDIRNEVTEMLESVLTSALTKHVEEFVANEVNIACQSGDFALNNKETEEGEDKTEDIHKYIYGNYAIEQKQYEEDTALNFPEDLITFEDNEDNAGKATSSTSQKITNEVDEDRTTENKLITKQKEAVVEKESLINNVQNTYLSEVGTDELLQKDSCECILENQSHEQDKVFASPVEVAEKQCNNSITALNCKSEKTEKIENEESSNEINILSANNLLVEQLNENKDIVIVLTPSSASDGMDNQTNDIKIVTDNSSILSNMADSKNVQKSDLVTKKESDESTVVVPALDSNSITDLNNHGQNLMLEVIEELNSDISLLSSNTSQNAEREAKALSNLIELSDQTAFSKSDDFCDKNELLESPATAIEKEELKEGNASKKEEKEEFNKTYQSVEKDIITMMQELLKESNDIKETVVLNGAEEDKTPPFVSIDINEEKNEDLCRTVVLDLVDMVLDNVDSKIDDIKGIDKEKAETTCLDASNKTPSGDATVEIKVSENILGEKNCTTVSELGPIEHKEFLTNTQPVYFCSPISTNKIASRIPKTSWSFGETSVHQENRKSVVPTKNHSRQFWLSKGDDKLLDSLEKCSDLFMNLFSELCCHSPIVQMNNIRSSNSDNINKTCIEGDCDTPPKADNNTNLKKSQPIVTRHQKLTDLKNPRKTTPIAETSKKTTRTTDEEELLAEETLTPIIMRNSEEYYPKVWSEEDISPTSKSSKSSRRTRISYISSSSSNDEILPLSSAKNSKKPKLEVKRSVSGQLALLKTQNPDIKVWAKTTSDLSESSSVTSTDNGYEEDRDSFSIPFPEPKYRYHSLHELNTPEEIAAIESNVRANDLLERQTTMVFERVRPSSPVVRRTSSSCDDYSFELSSEEVNDGA